MLLSDQTIRKYLNQGDIRVAPTVEGRDIRPNGIRVHLDPMLIELEAQRVDPRNGLDLRHRKIDLRQGDHILYPGQFILGSTVESIKMPRSLVGFLDGRSTLARLGLMIHVTAAVIDGLYEESRSITLEIYNAGNMEIVLSNNLAIGSLSFIRLDQPVRQDAQAQYRSQNKVTLPNLKGQFS